MNKHQKQNLLSNKKKKFDLSLLTKDKLVDKKEINHVPYSQALRIDKRSYLSMFLSVLANEIKIISLFYYKNPLVHLSLTTSIYFFESLLDLTINCFLYTDNYISEKYNNGKLKLLTTILLSFSSNFFSYIISYYIIKLIEYSELLEIIMKNSMRKQFYYLNIIKFKKYIAIKLFSFYIIQLLFNVFMSYYLTIFCIVYHQTQGSIMINYIVGIIQSLIFSLFFSIIISSLRYTSLKIRIKELYNTSKYLYENF